MKLTDLLRDFAIKSGISDFDTNPAYKDFLSLTTEIPDNLASAMQTNLMTIESAKANPTLKSHFFAQAYNGVDTELERLIGDDLFDDNFRTEIKGEKSSTQRMVKAWTKQKESLVGKYEAQLAELKKTGKGGSEEAETLRTQINSLNTQIANVRTEYEGKINTLKTEHESELTNLQLEQMLSGYRYAFPAEVPMQARLAAVKAVLLPEITSKGLKIVRKDGNLALLKSDGTDPYNETNQLITLKDLVSKTIADNKLLEVTPPGGGGNNNPPIPPPPPGGAGKLSDQAKSIYERNIANLQPYGQG
jgi:hypothetical protein